MTNRLHRMSILWVVLITAFWLMLSFAPWQPLFAFSPWLQFAAALVIFSLPGVCLYGLLRAKAAWGLDHVTSGFVLSHLLAASLGTAARLFQLPFTVVSYGMLALSLGLLLAYTVPQLARLQRPRLDRAAIQKALAYWPLALMTVLAGLMTLQRTLSDDDLSYLAYLTHWQHGPVLNFKDVFFGADKLAPVRFWLMSTPFSQAYLSELSRLPGIFIVGGYYEPFLAALALCSVYTLARTLDLSRRQAMLAVSLQLVYLAGLSEYLHPGAPFFRQLSTDKATAAYIFIPVFLQSVIEYLKQPSRIHAALGLLTGFSLMLMHPVALVFAVAVAGLITLFGLRRDNFRARLILLLLLGLVMAPQVATRFVRSEAQAAIPFSMKEILATRGMENMIAIWGDTAFYGFNPTLLAMHIPYGERLPLPAAVLEYGWLVFPLAGALLALKHLRHDFLSQYGLACFLLAAAAGLPFTGWLLGYLVSAWMLERTLWIYPFGIGTVFVFRRLSEWMDLTRRTQLSTALRPVWLPALTLLAASALGLVMREQNLPNLTRLSTNRERYTAFAQIGQFLDEHLPQGGYAAGTDELNDYIPGISSRAKLIAYRPADPSYPYFYPLAERQQRLSDRQAIFSRELPAADRLALIQKYEVRFLWLKSGEYSRIRNLLSEYPTLFSEHQVGGYYLIEVLESAVSR